MYCQTSNFFLFSFETYIFGRKWLVDAKFDPAKTNISPEFCLKVESRLNPFQNNGV
jgi:hypothetical protein